MDIQSVVSSVDYTKDTSLLGSKDGKDLVSGEILNPMIKTNTSDPRLLQGEPSGRVDLGSKSSEFEIELSSSSNSSLKSPEVVNSALGGGSLPEINEECNVIQTDDTKIGNNLTPPETSNDISREDLETLEELDKLLTESNDALKKASDLRKYEAGSILYVIKAHKALDLDELELELGDVVELEETPLNESEFWFRGITIGGSRNGARGFFPRANIALNENFDFSVDVSERRPSVRVMEAVDEPPIPIVSKGTAVVAVYAFEPSKQDELVFQVGAMIIILECPEGGWWKGITGMEEKKPLTGWFPANLVRVTDIALKEKDEERDGLAILPSRHSSWFKRLKVPEESDTDKKARLGKQLEFTEVEVFAESEVTKDNLLVAKDKTYDANDSARSSISLANAPRDDNESRSRSESFNLRGTMLLSGVLTADEIALGSTDEKIEDRVGIARYKGLNSVEKKRLTVLWELIQTERDYLRDISIVMDHFFKPMCALQSVGPKNMIALFANLEQILIVNTDFLIQLIQIDDICNITAYAEIFLTMVILKLI